MSVYNNMAYGLKIRGMPKAEIEARVQKAAAMLELAEFLPRKPRQLSGGQRQRVAMGRAIVREPSVFLFDEPLSNLDAKLRVQMRLEIKKLQHGLGITSVYVTHDQVEAMTLGHRLMVLNAGVVEQLGSPAMNFLSARVGADGATVALPGGDALALPEGRFSAEANREVTLGIRPEHLELTGDGDGIAHLSVQVVEQLGADTLIHGYFGGDRTDLTVRLRGTVNLKPDEVLPLRVAPEHLHLFDPAGGKRLDSA
jgi:sn-glycerol 3-phosphate transport system ATP-binding protein